MNIMLINTYYYPEIIGGAEYSVKKLSEQLVKNGHRVSILCTGDIEQFEIINGVFIYRIKSAIVCRALYANKTSNFRKSMRRLQDIWNFGNKIKIKQILEKENPDVIHTNGLYDISPIIWMMANKQGIKVIHTIRDYFLLCPLVSYRCDKFSKCKYKHNLCLIHKSFNYINSKYVDYVTAPSKKTLDIVCSKGYFKKSKKKVIPNAIDFCEEYVKSLIDNKRVDTDINFVYIGTLNKIKGVSWLLNSFSSISKANPEMKLYIAGKGDLEDEVKNAIKINENIIFVGFLDEIELNKFLESMNVLICPSLWDEPFGRVILDAYKNAMPAIVSNKGALPELVVDNQTGIIVDVNLPNSLSNAMLTYMNNPSLIKKHALNGLVELQKYSLEEQAKVFETMIYI